MLRSHEIPPQFKGEMALDGTALELHFKLMRRGDTTTGVRSKKGSDEGEPFEQQFIFSRN